MGGTGANHIMLGSGDAFWYSDGKGDPEVPPANEIENPNPRPGPTTGMRRTAIPAAPTRECADPAQPGVAPIVDYLKSLPDHPSPNCQPGHYYLLNNYDPGYFGNGTVDTERHLHDPALLDADDRRRAARARHLLDVLRRGLGRLRRDIQKRSTDVYCNICNPFQYADADHDQPADPHRRHQGHARSLQRHRRERQLPAVSFVKPGGLNDGHPGILEVRHLRSVREEDPADGEGNPALAKSTAVFITNDEGGGYYD